MANKKDKSIVCSFCGRNQDQTGPIISGEQGFICSECVDKCHNLLTSEKLAKTKNQITSTSSLLPPKEIHKKLDEYVIGHDSTKKMLSVAIYNHYKRLNYNSIKGEMELDKSNVLMIGPTGCGKTLIASTIAKIVNVPFAIADATTLTEAGYVGDDVENILLRLIQNADYDVERAERGIIFVDEMDKISRKSENTSITRDVSGEGVQQALLKIIEGTTATVPSKGGRKHPQSSNISIDTSNILFICGGAFVELEKLIKSRTQEQVIGFNAELMTKDKIQQDVLKLVSPDDLIKFGLIPELIGRLPVFCTMTELDDEAMRQILTKPKNAIIKQFKALLKMDDIDLTFEEDAYMWIIKKAKELKTGARGLRSVLEKVMNSIMYEAPSTSVKSISLTAEKLENENWAKTLKGSPKKVKQKKEDPKNIA